ncbi:MAG: hypothetical protein GY811_01285 [Myxococcales bacterium]|nr:hypothetical protein [Myxococcales bacterium]
MTPFFSPIIVLFFAEFLMAVDWFAFGLPVVIVLLPIIGAYLWKRIGVIVDAGSFDQTRSAATRELEATGRLSRDLPYWNRS